mgnify:FL=1
MANPETGAVTPRDRWLALGLLGAVLLLAYLVLIHSWWTVPMMELQARIDDLHARDGRARATLEQAPQIRKRLEAERAQAATVPGFMQERTPELATAALVQRLETAVEQASPGKRSCAIVNRSPLTEPRPERFPRAVVQARLTCGTPELAAVLHSLESGSPRLFVDNLNITAQRFFFSAEQSSQNNGLDVSFDLYGYLPASGAPANARR